MSLFTCLKYPSLTVEALYLIRKFALRVKQHLPLSVPAEEHWGGELLRYAIPDITASLLVSHAYLDL